MIIALAIGLAVAAAVPAREYKGPLDPVGPFAFADLDGRTHTDTEFKRKILIVHQWAAWCGPCVEGFPQAQKLYERTRKDPTVAFVSFDMDDDPTAISEFLSEFRKEYSFPVLLARPRFKIKALPYTWIVDREGYIREAFAGEGPDYADRVLELVEAVKRRPPVASLPPETVREARERNAREAAATR